MRARLVAPALLWAIAPHSAHAAEMLNGASLSIAWVLPFAGLLLSIATGPLLYPRVWEHHYGKFAAFWAAATIVPLIFVSGLGSSADALLHTLLLEYLPFILLLLALFTVAGGIYVEGNLRGTPATNTMLLGAGAVLASVIGTTGASMILVQPLIRANDDRIYNVHTIIFFIFIVSNIGGALTPHGDPPLFVGFLKGVDFFWTMRNLALPTVTACGTLLILFFCLDSWMHRREEHKAHPLDLTPDSPLKLCGKINFLFLSVIIGAVLMSADWRPGISLRIGSSELQLQNVVRDLIFVGVTLLSMKFTQESYRKSNGFEWHPIIEVAKLFAAIFVCILPVTAILHAGKDGAFSSLLALVSRGNDEANNIAYFWLTGALSSFLDNAPTYLLFFELAGGDPAHLMTTMAPTLIAISAGAVFMGANTYIGNAPNFMVYSISRRAGVKMPSFFGYMLWSGLILLPLFGLLTFLFFR